jgi:ABC-type nitrate/sulfonate/bicarbonate transport system substrate-binding protein
MRLSSPARRRTTAGGIAILAIAALAFAGCSGSPGTSPSGQKLTTVKIGETAPFQVANYLTLVASNLGYFKEEGIDPQFIGISTNPIAPLISGDVDIMTVGINGLSALEQGQDIKFIDAFPANAPFTILVANDTKAAKDAHKWPDVMNDLVGVGIGTTVPGAFTDNLTRYLVTLSGHTLSQIPVTPAGDATSLVAGLKSGTFKAGFVPSPLFEPLVKQGGFTQALNLWEGDVPDFSIPVSTPAVTGAWAKAHPDLVKGFQIAVQKANVWAKNPKNKAALTTMVANRLSVDQSTITAPIDTFLKTLGDSTEYTKDQWNLGIKIFRTNGVLSKNYNYSDYVIPFPSGSSSSTK